jgi:hypothetical protein
MVGATRRGEIGIGHIAQGGEEARSWAKLESNRRCATKEGSGGGHDVWWAIYGAS